MAKSKLVPFLVVGIVVLVLLLSGEVFAEQHNDNSAAYDWLAKIMESYNEDGSSDPLQTVAEQGVVEGSGQLPFEEYNSPPTASGGQQAEQNKKQISHPICPGSVGNLALDPSNKPTNNFHHVECRYIETRYVAGHYQTYILASFSVAWAEDNSVSDDIKKQLCMPSYIGWEEWSDNGKAASITNVYLHDDEIALKEELKNAIKEGLGKAEARALPCGGGNKDEFSEDDFIGIIPDDTSCEDFGVDPKDFDLAYDKEMINKEFKDFLKEYSSTHYISSGSNKYILGIDYILLELFLFTEEVQDWRFKTGKENDLGKRIDERFKKEGRGLTPAEIFEESLIINNNNMYDALLTAHNYLKNETLEVRLVRENYQLMIDKNEEYIKACEKRLLADGVVDAYTGQISDRMHMSESSRTCLEKIPEKEQEIKKLMKHKREHVGSFSKLEEIRATDNEGAWYHLFGAMTWGYVLPCGKCAIFAEHRVYKGIVGRGRRSGIDLPEYCWDWWAVQIGSDISTAINLKEIEEANRDIGWNTPFDYKASFIKAGFSSA